MTSGAWTKVNRITATARFCHVDRLQGFRKTLETQLLYPAAAEQLTQAPAKSCFAASSFRPSFNAIFTFDKDLYTAIEDSERRLNCYPTPLPRAVLQKDGIR
jgi:hypothetical protein